MVRRNGRRFIAAMVAVLSVGVLSPVVEPRDSIAQTDTRPNVLIILTDDQREGMHVMPQTRSFFGRFGTEFSEGFANTPLCCPARATLMTGQYPHNHGVHGNNDSSRLDPNNTLQADLQAAGYRTAIFGKYLNGFPVEQMGPPGFDRFAVFKTPARGYYGGGTWNVNGTVQTLTRYTSHVLRDKGVRFIRANKDRPWLMILSVPAPHRPFVAERRYAKARVGTWAGNPAVFETNRSDKPPWVSEYNMTLKKGRYLRKRQLRTLLSVDDMVGGVRSALRETGQARETLAFFTSDNAYLWGEHGMSGKTAPYMQTIKVPFYARWPGNFGRGRVDRRIVSHIDITATAYEATGVEPEHELDGYSLLGTYRRQRLLTEMAAKAKHIPIWSSLLTAAGDHYIEYRSGDEVIFRELYELGVDPWELRNVARERSDKSAELAALLAVDRLCTGALCP
jgi:arylsulfatase A-like enzyme